jgi:nucleoside-diphosphate-sugar epimerase
VGESWEAVEIDLRHLELLPDLIDRIRPSITFNLAGYGVDRSERDEGLARLLNAEFPHALAEALGPIGSTDWPHLALVHAGSGAEYGPIGTDLTESTTGRPVGPYATSKLAGTLFLRGSARALGLRALTARLFTVYGPGEHAGRLLPALRQASRTEKPLELTAGSQMRDFTYVEDIASGLLRLGLSPATPGEIVNLATGILTSVRQFAETAASVMAIPPERLLFGGRQMGPADEGHGRVVIDRLRALLSWSPPTGIEAGIRRTLERDMEAGPDGDL